MIYKTGNVFRIICLNEPCIQYVGSTFNQLRHKWSVYKKDYKDWLAGNNENHKDSILFSCMKKYGVENFKMVLIKKYTVCAEHIKDHRHLVTYEQLWISKLLCINNYNPFSISWLIVKGREKKMRENEKIATNSYYYKNRTKIIEQKKMYNKGIIKEKKEYDTIRYKSMKEKLSEKVLCECGSQVSRYGMNKHRKTKKHNIYLEQQAQK